MRLKSAGSSGVYSCIAGGSGGTINILFTTPMNNADYGLIFSAYKDDTTDTIFGGVYNKTVDGFTIALKKLNGSAVHGKFTFMTTDD